MSSRNVRQRKLVPLSDHEIQRRHLRLIEMALLAAEREERTRENPLVGMETGSKCGRSNSALDPVVHKSTQPKN